jgi:glycosyltransferase involved in cell wall biosynthesis
MGKKGWNVGELSKRIEQHPQNGRSLFWLENGADDEVDHLLSQATALVQASIAEGFGLPIIEAGSQGVPLVLSDIPVFREIAGEEATYFAVGQAEELASLIGQAVQSREWRRPQALKAMTWQESAAKLANLLLGEIGPAATSPLPRDL